MWADSTRGFATYNTGDFLLQDDFSGPLDWEKAADASGPGDVFIQDEELHTSTTGYWYNVTAMRAIPQLADFEASVRFKMMPDSASSTNVGFCVFSESVTDGSATTIGLGYDGYYKEWTPIIEAACVERISTSAIPLGIWTTIGMKKQENTYTFLVDDSVIATFTGPDLLDTSFVALQNGVGVHWEGGTHVHYDDFSIGSTASLVNAPTVTNSSGATDVTPLSARLNGEITHTGGEAPSVTVYYGTTDGGTTPSGWEEHRELGIKGAGTFYADITGLTDNTTYYYRCYASNSHGDDWADSAANLTTPPTAISAPVVTNSSGATNITSTSARLRGEITDTGGQDPTVHIYWGCEDGGDDADAWDEHVDVGTRGAGAFYADVSGLSPLTTYHYRCYGSNFGGDGWACTTANFTTVQSAVLVSIDVLDMVGVDADFTATITIGDITDLNAAQYDVSFDEAVLRLDDVTPGEIGSTTIPVAGFSHLAPGTYRVVQSMGLGTASGAGYLAELHFHVVGSLGQNSNIDFSNGLLSNIYAEKVPAVWVGHPVYLSQCSVFAGDATGDGQINVLDMTKVARVILMLDSGIPATDANGDGNINVLDMTKIARIILGLD